MASLIPQFTTGKSFVAEVTMEKLNALAKRSVMSVSGAITMTQGPGGTALHVPPPVRMPTRSYVLSAGSSSGLPGLFPYDAITYDLPATNTAALLGSLSGGVFTFEKEGFFLCTYHGTAAMDLGGATTATPGQIKVEANFRLGGVDLSASRSTISAAKIPNFDGFVTNPDSSIEQSVSLDGATGKTEAITTASVAACEGSYFSGVVDEYGNVSGPVTNTCIDVLTAAELDGSNQLAVTLDNADIDVGTSLEVIADSEPTGTGWGALSSCALVQVFRNSSGVLQINGLSPTVAVYGTVTDGDADIINATLSIIQI